MTASNPLMTASIPRRDFLRWSTVAAAAAAGGVAGVCGSEGAEPSAAGKNSSESTSEWQLGCFTRPFGQFSFAQALDGISSVGFTAVGLMSARLGSGNVTLAEATDEQVNEIREAAAERHLAIAATYYGGPPVKQSLEAGIQELRKLIANCRQSGCATIVCGGTTEQALFEHYYQAIREVCDQAAEQKVALVLKPHGGLNATGPECRQIVEHVGHDAFRLWYDPGNIFYYSEGKLDPLDDVDSVAGLVTGMCVKDFVPPRDVAVNPGSGQVRFAALMQRLQAGGFRSGPLIVETLAPGDLEATTANALKARQFLTTILAGSR